MNTGICKCTEGYPIPEQPFVHKTCIVEIFRNLRGILNKHPN